jgi:L-lactate dehydrogenase complex protein LldF
MSAPLAHFKADAQRKATDLRHRGIIQTAMGKYEVVRDQRKLWFQDWQGARNLAARTKFEAVNHLDTHLAEFAKNLEARGTKVHWASNAEQARNIILGILKEKSAKVIVKSKAMTSEEIHLNDAMEKRATKSSSPTSANTSSSCARKPPYHLVFPAMHLTRGEIKDPVPKETQRRAVRRSRSVDDGRAAALRKNTCKPTSASRARTSPSPRRA